ncbi:trimethylamine-corrinoid protein Co-methyltransferase [Acididesulfobacillus acetoxydans]|uniref:Trimethylamine methyltransferase MttB n=1 Tax=Acididesulfobacillus acetoxydans TaxID=1561005 RepID=A0A8S0Y2B1_9FIRM|nr:trimethylamine methyltransferase family protein [Acididesulfobacillus acetoxydans]CAA7600555.1 trimethylamine-corrinoid protein Co-methyltransferase [Acididesulfobacillus acetoxydans]CEJ06689.1 Trimethylamine methyltransferase MttB [Acididesulfobacillus acetoxydans]
MKVNMASQTTVGLNLLSEDQIEEIHSATLQVLQTVGVDVYEEEALVLLKGSGADVEGNRVRIPVWMVQEALASAPKSVTLYNRQGEAACVLEKGRIYYGSGSDTPYTIDLETGKRRLATNEDVGNAAKLADALEHINFIMSLGLASDTPKESSDVYQYLAMVTNTTKPIVFTAHDKQGLLDIHEISALVAGGERELRRKPFLALYAEPSSPLMHSKEAVEKLLACAEKEIPVIYVPATMRGATGPVTPAGSLVVANAEQLSGLVVHQLKRRGAPFIYGGGTPPMDLRTFICSYGSPERDLGCTALVKIGQHYNLPTFTTAGCSDAHVFDQQAGMEAGFNLLIAGLAGGNLIHDAGYIGIGLISSMEMLVLCDETVNNVKYYLNGIEVNTETLAVDVIKAVGPGGNFIGEEHTLKHFRQNRINTHVLNRENLDNWELGGARTFGELANERAKELLAEHEVPSLPAEVLDRIEEIVRRKRGLEE